MADVEMGEVVYGPYVSFIRCVCARGRVEVSLFFACDHAGDLDVIDGPCFRCWECGRVYSADAVVLTRIEVTAT